MNSNEIVVRLQLNRNDLNLIRSNPTNLPQSILDSIIKSVEERCPYKGCQLFKVLNALDRSNFLPEDNLSLDQLISVFETFGDMIDKLFDTSKSDDKIVYFPHPKLDSKKVVQILVYQMMFNANEATSEFETENVIRNMFL